MSNMNNVTEIRAHHNLISDLSFAPTDKKFVTASDDGTLGLFDFETQTRERSCEGQHMQYSKPRIRCQLAVAFLLRCTPAHLHTCAPAPAPTPTSTHAYACTPKHAYICIYYASNVAFVFS